MFDSIAQVENECVVGSLRPLSDYAPLDCVRTFRFSEMAQMAALESFHATEPHLDDDADYDNENLKQSARTEKGSRYESGYSDRIALEAQEAQERASRVDAYREQGELNEPLDYRTDESVRMEAAMDTFIKFCDLLADAPDVP